MREDDRSTMRAQVKISVHNLSYERCLRIDLPTKTPPPIMGATGSKGDLSVATRPRSKSRRKFYGVLKHNFDLIEDKLRPERLSDDEYRVVRDLIEATRADLLTVADDVKQRPKYADLYNSCMERCISFERALQSKRAVVSAPSSPSTKKRRRKKSERGRRDSYKPPETLSFEAVHRIRAEMQPLRDEVLTFKGAKHDRIYHFLQESFHRYIVRLRAIETFERVQLKYEQQLAIAYAKESQDVLDEICDGCRPWLSQSTINVEEKRGYVYGRRDADDDDGDDSDDDGSGPGKPGIQRKRSKSMGDGLNKKGSDFFVRNTKFIPRRVDHSDSSGSDNALTSDFSDAPPMTPLSTQSRLSCNFKVTSI